MIIKKTTGGAVKVGSIYFANLGNVMVYQKGIYIAIKADHEEIMVLAPEDIEFDGTEPSEDIDELLGQIAELFVVSGGSGGGTDPGTDPGPAYTDITWPTPELVNTNKVWTRAVDSNGPAHFKAGQRVEANEEFRLILGTPSQDANVKFLIGKAVEPTQGNSEYGLLISAFQGNQRLIPVINGGEGGSNTTTAPYSCVYRDATGLLHIQESYNQTAWTNVYDWPTAEYLGILYFAIYTENHDLKIYDPRLEIL